VASRRANSKAARSERTPHARPDIRLQPIHSARLRNASTLTIRRESSIYAPLHEEFQTFTAAPRDANGTGRPDANGTVKPARGRSVRNYALPPRSALVADHGAKPQSRQPATA
jgi:hypothetical protein